MELRSRGKHRSRDNALDQQLQAGGLPEGFLHNGSQSFLSLSLSLAELPETGAREQLGALLEAEALLDRYHIPTLYPNSLPDLTPGQVYFRRDAESCHESALQMIAMVRKFMAVPPEKSA
jgi:hypothetical protein